MKKNTRIQNEHIPISTTSVNQFWAGRSQKYCDELPEMSMMLQDHHPELVRKRDAEEKRILLPLMQVKATDRVLDIGCGYGRWAHVLADHVQYYLGTDPVAELIELAKAKAKPWEHVHFLTCGEGEDYPKRVMMTEPFQLILLSGVLQYVNDDALIVLLQNARDCAASTARIVIRSSFAYEERLTLDHFWVDELQAEYSAIYRTLDEFRKLLIHVFPQFTLTTDQPMFPEALTNRRETGQHIFVLERYEKNT